MKLHPLVYEAEKLDYRSHFVYRGATMRGRSNLFVWGDWNLVFFSVSKLPLLNAVRTAQQWAVHAQRKCIYGVKSFIIPLLLVKEDCMS